MDWEKRHRGRLRMSASRSYSPSLSPLAFGHLPLTRGVGPGPQYGGDAYLLGCVKFPARGNLSGWSKFPSAHRGLGQQKLQLVRFHFRAWLC